MLPSWIDTAGDGARLTSASTCLAIYPERFSHDDDGLSVEVEDEEEEDG